MRLRNGIGVATAIVRDGKLLLGRRIARNGNGLWQTPGGKPDRGETLAAAALRETLEETGLAVSQPQEIARQFDDFPEIGYRYETVFFGVRCETGEPVNTEPDKCEGWSWHPLDTLPPDRFAIDAETIAAIRAYADGDGLVSAVRALFGSSGFLTLATVDDAGQPHASYVPYARAGGYAGFALSGLAAHTKHLAARAVASFVIVGENGDAASDAYARSRIAVTADVRALAGGSGEAREVWDALRREHGATVDILRTLPDFTVYRTVPRSARLILGFAAAYDVASDVLQRALATGS